MGNLFKGIGSIVAILIALVSIVEKPGDGAKKKEKVIDLFLEKADEHLTGLPKWASDLFVRRSFIGWLVDVIVWAANATGFFDTPVNGGTDSGNSPKPASTASA